MRKILVTGGLGFIGSNLLRMWKLEHPDDEVVVLDAETYAADCANVSGLDLSWHRIDLRDREAVREFVKDVRPDGVIHLAAETHVDRSIGGPEAFFETNAIGTVNLLEACRGVWSSMDKAGRFVHVSTDEVFGHLGAEGEFSEDSPYRPRSPYAASKAGADHAARAYALTYGMDVVVTHCTNNFGPRQHREKLIPKIIDCCIKQKPIQIYGEGANVRDWLFVDDHCWGIMQAFELGAPGSTYAFSGGNELPNRYVAKLICAMMDRLADEYVFLSSRPHEELIEFVEDRKGHDFRYAMSSEKVRREWGWTPEVPFDVALEDTLRWYLDKYVAGQLRVV